MQQLTPGLLQLFDIEWLDIRMASLVLRHPLGRSHRRPARPARPAHSAQSALLNWVHWMLATWPRISRSLVLLILDRHGN